MKIADMNAGETARVTGYESGSRSYRQKLLRMGLVKGCTFTLVRKAPLGDPVELEVGQHRVTLRRSEADVLIVDRAES
jgi:ferrous iron transport protein A